MRGLAMRSQSRSGRGGEVGGGDLDGGGVEVADVGDGAGDGEGGGLEEPAGGQLQWMS